MRIIVLKLAVAVGRSLAQVNNTAAPELAGSKSNALVRRAEFLVSVSVANVSRTLLFVSLFPAGMNVGATWNKRLAYERGRALGYESRDKGVTVQLGPVAGALGRSSISGRNVQACAKHFIGNEQEHFRQTPESRDYGFNITQPGSSNIDDQTLHELLIREIEAASTILLKNTHGFLPLNNSARLTAVFGEDAGSNLLGPNGCRNHACGVGTLAVGWGSGQASSPYLITPDAAIQHEVVSRYGSYESITNNSAFTQINALARRVNDVTGVCIVFANADSGQGFVNVDGNYGDRNNLTLWQGADAVIRNVSAVCNNTVLIMHSVGAVEIDEYKDNPNITTILWAGLPGEQSGYAITDVLYGHVNPGAKLAFTMERERSDYGTDVLYTPNQEVPQYNFQEGVFIDYRGFDHRNVTPMYEFGFGLSYTTFEYSNLEVEKFDVADYEPTIGISDPAPTTNLSEACGADNFDNNSFVPKDALYGSTFDHPPSSGPNGGNQGLWDIVYHVRVNLTNTGDVVGDEVAQLYVSLGGPYDPKVVL
ncbi:glycoside hydrolase family 3 protein [Aureobasidium subglaciale]|nr:glycoside hydrolase family 3 protein [Aureobasidium subglaciale]